MATKFTVKHKRSSARNGNGTANNPYTVKAPTAEQCTEGEIVLNYLDGYENLFIQNSNGAIVRTKLGPLDTELNEESTMGVENQAIAKSVNEIYRQLNNIAHTYSIFGVVRVNGDIDPDGSVFIGKAEDFQREFKDVCRFGHFTRSGNLFKDCAPCRIDYSSEGEDLKIDGSSGDVLVYVNRSIYTLKFTANVEGVELSVFAISLNPFTIYGRDAKEIKPFAFDPHASFNTKLTANEVEDAESGGFEADSISCLHSIYNTKCSPTDTTVAYTPFKQNYRANGRGYPTQNTISQVSEQWLSQAKNPTQTVNRPWTGFYYEFYEVWLMMMFVEIGSLNSTPLNLFGVGTTQADMPTSNAAVNCKYIGDPDASGLSGWMLVKDKGDGQFTKVMGNLSTSLKVYGTQNYTGRDVLCGNYTTAECLEPQRILSDIAKSGLVNKIWDGVSEDANKGLLFTHDGEGTAEDWSLTNTGNMIVAKNVTADMFADGNDENIVPGKRYYQVRNVPGCAGMADGAMTAVINVLIKRELDDNKGYNDLYDYGIFKISYPVYRGMSVSSNFRYPLQGCYYRAWTDDKGTTHHDFICASDVEKVPAILNSSTGTNVGNGNWNQELTLEKGLDILVPNARTVSGWATMADYGASLFCFTNTSSSAGMHTHEAAYVSAPANAASEKKSLYTVAVSGGTLHLAFASARYVYANVAVSYVAANWAGRFSLPSIGGL